jgi:hypothetical protein
MGTHPVTRVALAAVLLLCACRDTTDPPPSDDYMIVRFGFRNDGAESFDFVARATRPSLLDSIRAELARPVDERRFPNGPVRAADPGENLAWSWAYEPDAWHLTDFSIELCDATPRYVEDHLDEWLGSVGHYCPWAAYVKDTTWVR